MRKLPQWNWWLFLTPLVTLVFDTGAQRSMNSGEYYPGSSDQVQGRQLKISVTSRLQRRASFDHGINTFLGQTRFFQHFRTMLTQSRLMTANAFGRF